MEGQQMTLSDENTQDDGSNDNDGPTSVNGVVAADLKNLIKRIELLEERKAGMAADIELVKDEAKSQGFDVKTLNQILKLRKMDATTIEAEELLLEVYKRALGMTE